MRKRPCILYTFIRIVHITMRHRHMLTAAACSRLTRKSHVTHARLHCSCASHGTVLNAPQNLDPRDEFRSYPKGAIGNYTRNGPILEMCWSQRNLALAELRPTSIHERRMDQNLGPSSAQMQNVTKRRAPSIAKSPCLLTQVSFARKDP